MMLELVVSQDCWNAVAQTGGYFLFKGVIYRLTTAARTAGEDRRIRVTGEPVLAENDDLASELANIPDLSARSV
jgi:hypothetical protein